MTTSASEKRAQELVLAAYRQIAERGFEGLRTRDVARSAGVNIATLHYYFPTKEALIGAVLQHAMERFRTTLEPRGAADSQLRGYLRATRKLLRDEPELGAVMSELALRSVRDAGTRKILDEMYAQWFAAVRGLLRRAAREGNLRSDLDSESTAALIVATLHGLALPQVGDSRRGDQAVRELERLLGV
ncbi:MAG TPA: TetR/AcrR family transcriptional regulator [Candidatus Dormibacteraeota bacterium]|nr:TetR/AcrR family transcriptional regulator [Candidatus Dormibacteraeota bacterium]